MKSKLLCSAFLMAALSATACSSGNDAPEMPGDNPTEGNVLFFDDFASFNNSVWTKETHPAGWVNQELESYAPSQVTTGKDGDKTVLILTATRNNGKIVSGRINSQGKKSFGTGCRVEASIKLPVTNGGLWPAFWMMGDNDREWPACGEIDIFEMGHFNGMANGTYANHVNTAIHYGETPATHQQQYYANPCSVNLQDGKYHIYALERSGNHLDIYIDGVNFHSFDISGNNYFDGNFFVLFNLAVGGEFTGLLNISEITALKDGQSASMMVDWIKVTKL